jgi:hypothetical protein
LPTTVHVANRKRTVCLAVSSLSPRVAILFNSFDNIRTLLAYVLEGRMMGANVCSWAYGPDEVIFGKWTAVKLAELSGCRVSLIDCVREDYLSLQETFGAATTDRLLYVAWKGLFNCHGHSCHYWDIPVRMAIYPRQSGPHCLHLHSASETVSLQCFTRSLRP